MTTRQRIAIALLAIAILTLLLLGCTDWDGMDRSDWDWDGPTATPVLVPGMHAPPIGEGQ